MVTPRPPKLEESVPLAPMTTLGVGGEARFFVDAVDEKTLFDALDWAKQASVPVAVLGGGSNVLVSDRGFDGLVLRVRLRGVEEISTAREGRIALRVGAGEELDSLVESCVARGVAGIECLSGIPGYAGATPIQNVGAYGQEIGETIFEVRALSRAEMEVRAFDNASCRFSYRSSAFKEELRDRFIVLSVTLLLCPGGAPAVRYPELARELAARGATAPSLADVRRVVLQIRRSKSMVLDPTDPNGKSAGSFFVNPIVAPQLADEVEARARSRGASAMPRFPGGARVKLSAAWLIEQSGFTKGTAHGNVGISTKHALALVNKGGATAREIATFARRVQDAVRERFGIALDHEPVLLGFSAEEARTLHPVSANDTVEGG